MKKLLILLLVCMLPFAAMADDPTLANLAQSLHDQTALTLTEARRCGDALLIEYTLRGISSDFTPTPAQLADMEPAGVNLLSGVTYEEGVPLGYVVHSIETPRLTAADGAALTGLHGYTGVITNNLLIRSESWGLPADLAATDALSLSIPVSHSITFVYYDGAQVFARAFTFDYPTLEANVSLDDGAVHFSGAAELNGMVYYLRAIHHGGQLTATVYTLDAFPSLADGQWFDLETNLGNTLVATSVRDSHTLLFTFEDVSQPPQALEAALVIASNQGATASAAFQMD